MFLLILWFIAVLIQFAYRFTMTANDCISTKLVDIYPIWAGTSNIVVIFPLFKLKPKSQNILFAQWTYYLIKTIGCYGCKFYGFWAFLSYLSAPP